MPRKRRLKSPWPFPVSVNEKGRVFENLPPHPRKPPKPRKLKPVPPSSEWTQDQLFESSTLPVQHGATHRQ